MCRHVSHACRALAALFPARLLPASPKLLPFLWPVLALLGSGLHWLVLQNDLDEAKVRAEQGALREVRSYAEGYERYLTRSLAEFDQISMQLRQSWEQGSGSLDLAELRRQGMFTDSAFLQVAVIGPRGQVVTALHPNRASDTGRDTAFAYHRDNNSSAMRIGVAPGDSGARQHTLRITRRLEHADDRFGGILSLLIDSRYLTGFYNDRALGTHGLLAVLAAEGDLRLESHGATDAGATRHSLFSSAPAMSGDAGATQLPAADFSDGRARLVAWHHSSAYPVVAVAGVAADEALAAAGAEAAHERRSWAVLASGLLASSMALAELTRRVQRRRGEERDIRRAYRAATENAKDGFYMASAVRDSAGRVVDFDMVDCNERGASFYGLERADLVGRRIAAIEQEYGGTLLDACHEAMRTGIFEDEHQMPGGRRMQIGWGRRRLVRIGNGLAITLQDVSDRKAYEEELLYLANYDVLTALPNRTWLTRHLPRAVADAAQNGTAFGLLFLDLDDFKHVNDTRGHGVGDELLKQAAGRLGRLLRPGDTVARLGGDEFVVLIDPAGTQGELATIAGRIVTALTEPFTIAAEQHLVSVSIGISRFPGDGADANTLIKHGDIAMYAAKAEGGGRHRFFDPELYRATAARIELRQYLQQAVERGELELHYQPRVDLATGRLSSMEALLRWHHPLLGTIAPVVFIPIAEESGLIAAIGRFVVERACAQLADWRARALPLVPLSINVSPQQFERGGVHAHLAMLLAKHHLPPALLEVEITESAIIAEGSDVRQELASLRALGVRLHVDDFGTGYSSLAQLQRLQMDVLKIDRAFTTELTVSREGRALFEAIVSMAKALGMGVVAEGVETRAQLDALMALGCEEAQGYFFAQPMPAARAEQLLLAPQLLLTGPPALRCM
ncbi:diguanylate cyclase (GGDEF)-like protein [Pseudoduganella lurida]|uniref:Diguanylate cyclase (GGDEF)-like protein n=1 Tax=Pseudoduganella lurida TaxID=1036180 RepID=A0A562RE79_9BURK|nr:EAL domain-containing protein [Pseudoduganella lurida]TWI67372.1 diguanylate cyclase (GGDEF)-like protein [Pseudoduganella lurida]